MRLIPIDVDTPQARLAEAIAVKLAQEGCTDTACLTTAISIMSACQDLVDGDVEEGIRGLKFDPMEARARAVGEYGFVVKQEKTGMYVHKGWHGHFGRSLVRTTADKKDAFRFKGIKAAKYWLGRVKDGFFPEVEHEPR